MPPNSNTYYPPLSDILSPNDFPEILNFVKEGMNNFLEDIYYQNIQQSKSGLGDSAFYSLDIVTKKKISFEIPGSSIFFILNPDFTNGSASVFPITVFWEWKILAKFHDFNLSNFSFSFYSIYELLLQFFEISEEQLFANALTQFVHSTDLSVLPINKLVSDINLKYGTNISSAPQVGNQVVYLLNEIKSNLAIQPLEIIYEFYIKSNSLPEIKQKLHTAFSNYLSGDIEQYIKTLIIPKIRVSLQLLGAIEFPRNLLNPVFDEFGNNPYGLSTGNPYEIIPADANGDPKVLLKFAEALFYADTEHGIGNAVALTLTTSVPAQIANSGLIIHIQNLKLDLSNQSNFIEADLEGRSPDFVGIYSDKVEIILPKKWFKKENGQSLKISALRLLLGTGGISGTLALQTINNTPPQLDDYFWFKLGKDSSKAWRIGFNSFDLTFRQSAITSSNITAALEIPRFSDINNSGDPFRVDLIGHYYEDGDFSLTASIAGGLEAHISDLVYFNFLSFDLGRSDDNFYIGTSCEIWFGESIMQRLLGDQKIQIPQLRIYSNGHIEFVGGLSFIPLNITLNLGPIEIAVTSINIGSFQQIHNGVQRNYNFFGFDGAISIDPLGIDAKGEGVKYYYTVDNDPANGKPPHSFLRIQTIEIDLIIPGSANPASAVAIIHGMVSIPAPGVSPEYIGEVSLKLPKVKISGGAGMRLQPKSPAFLVDAFIDLPKPIPLGPLGIYGFRGLIGFRYVAEKEAVGLVSGVDTWYDYYKFPRKGINIRKFSGPERTRNYSFPFSIGAGAVLGTSFDSGTTISVRAMLLLSIPTLFLIEGKATILSARLGLEATNEPPFFAFVAWGDHSIEMGLGADFKLPTSNGWILDLQAEVQAGFFFNNSSRWYVNFGTKQNPISARLLTVVTARTYLMISAQGIEAGARVEFDLRKHFGPAKVHLYAYLEIGGRISFARPQIGGYIALGGMIDIEIWIVGISIRLDAILSVEAAKPFLLFAELRIRVCIKVVVRICKSFTIQLKWEKDNTVDRSPIPPLPYNNTDPGQQDRTKELVKAVNMLTNSSFELDYFTTAPGAGQISKVIPSDTFIDIRVAKGLIPNAISSMIGGHTTAAENFTDLVPPESISRSGRQLRQVKHSYSIESIAIKAWTGSQWVNYHPYQAIIENEVVTNLRIGYWQRSGDQYDTLRILATDPFSFMQSGEPGWFIPEQYGINPSSLFCAGQFQLPHCSNVLNKPVNTIYYPPQQYVGHFINGAYYTLHTNSAYDPALNGVEGLTGNYMKVTDSSNPFGFAKSLAFNNYNSLVIFLPDPSVTLRLNLTTNAAGATINFYQKIISTGVSEPQYALIDAVYKTKAQLSNVLDYVNNATPVSKIVITPNDPNAAAINIIMQQIAALFDTTYNEGTGEVSITEPSDLGTYNELLYQLSVLQETGCTSSTGSFFSGYYGTDNSDINFFKATHVIKFKDHYLIAAEYSTVNDDPGYTASLLLKIDANGELVSEAKFTGVITDIKIIEDKILLTLGKRINESDPLETPCLLKLDETLTEISGKELEPVYKNQYNQLCLLPGTQYGLWLSSNYVSPGGAGSAFENMTRILLFDIDSLEIYNSLLVDRSIAIKAVIPDANTCIFISGADPIDKKSAIVTIAVSSQNQLSVSSAFDIIDVLTDITLLQNGEIIVTGKKGISPNIKFVGLLQGNVINSYDFGNADFDLRLSTDSLQAGAISFLAYDDSRVYKFNTDNGMVLVGTKEIMNPGGFPGSVLNIKQLVNNSADAEVLMLSGDNDTKGVVFSKMNEVLDSCEFQYISFEPLLQFEELPLTERIVESFEIETISNDTWDIVSASDFINVFQNVCPPIPSGNTVTQCMTSLQDICWLTINQYQYNLSIPGQGAIAQDQQDMVAAMQKTAQPIWRPETKYYIHFQLKDTVDNGQSAPGVFNYYYGFQTVGPLGHYHKNPLVNPLPVGANADQSPLSSLRQYIDYNRSYPNADGNLLQSKPLFYGNGQCKISLFFSKASAYHMMQNWYAYNGLPALSGEMHIVIKDPVTNVTVPYPLPVNWSEETVPVPDGSPVWSGDNDPRIPLNIQMLNNMINYVNSQINAIQCTLAIGLPIQPAAYTFSVTLTNLAPRKLYTAILYNAFRGVGASEMKSEQVHQFGFQTSRYPNFEEQVNSFILTDDQGNEKQAVFEKRFSISQSKIDTVFNIAAGITDPASTAIESKYIDLFDRATEGIIGITPEDPAETTEITIFRQQSTENIFALLISNPEPFNNPKIPLQDILDTIMVRDTIQVPSGAYAVLHSKDRSKALIVHQVKISVITLQLVFKYKTWNGSEYNTASTVITPSISLPFISNA